jgi:hypothetical protein
LRLLGRRFQFDRDCAFHIGKILAQSFLEPSHRRTRFLPALNGGVSSANI